MSLTGDAPINPRAYQIGVCFTCQTCTYCGIDLTFENCECSKSIKPSKNNRTKQVPNVRNLAYKPDKAHFVMKNFLSASNEKYGYKLDMNQSRSCTLCSLCNSKVNRDIKAADKEKTSEIPDFNHISSPQSSTLSQIEFHFRMSIKQNKQVSPFIIVNFTLIDPSFIEFRNKIETYICEQVGLVFK